MSIAFPDFVPAQLPQVLSTVAIVAGSVVAGWLLKLAVFGLLTAYVRREPAPLLASSVLRHLRQPSAWFFPVLVLSFLLPLTPLTARTLEVARRLVETALLTTFAWGLVKTVDVIQDLVQQHYRIAHATDNGDNLRVRKLFTQLQFVKKLVVSLIIFVAVALVLMSFATVRKIGTGLLTSAGIASVIIGFAAQKSIGNLLAGFQIAFTQPIRLDDVLVVEGEWGRVEEITFTYVVLCIWDERRLVLPLNYFIEKPFQNWTRSTAHLLGTVFLYTDYSIPVEAVRAELQRLVAQHPLWDQRVCVLQVTDSKERTLELRCLMSARNSGDAFDLRCDIREQLVAFIQQHHPESLPKTRALTEPTDQPFSPAPIGAVG
ncbi:mechanosensitive ion channel family protein [Hymenobacter rubripertinctus]|uniref:Mechanosensitive ion channel family protein n=1 Tax=Hymenobacter rubripertinctus TaxID=2029981 RepID=A0A418QVG7_9BACT|nr:mechanosensitive ion channel domain-containing protein [Hymenobacter rubripertinctus]RIY09222.1 mechanosensitive ion channel family protein [Hymenobacter rubripertinctus]